MIRKLRCIFGVGLIIVAAATSNVIGQTILRVDQNGGSPNNGASWATAITSLRAAVDASHAHADEFPPAEIWVAADTWTADDTGDEFGILELASGNRKGNRKGVRKECH